MESLLGLTLEQLKGVAERLGAPSYVGKQLADWLYSAHVVEIEQMSNLSRAFRARLCEGYAIGARPPVLSQRSSDGTVKYLFPTADGHFVETVYIPDGARGTLCVSCQVGCKMGCKFCMTGRQGFKASLSAGDILNQLYSLPERESLTNVVFMGQGEPLDNLDNVLAATRILTAPWGFGWSPKRITVSTVGLQKGLRRFLDESRCHLAVSLHHPVPSGRAELMPAEKAFGIEAVVELLKSYDFCRKVPFGGSFARARRGGMRIESGVKQRRLSFEYIVFKGINDSRAHADALLRLLKGLDCRVNLIRFHAIPDTPLSGVDDAHMMAFRSYLTTHGLFATVRASRGEDIFAACGLLSTAEQEALREAEGL